MNYIKVRYIKVKLNILFSSDSGMLEVIFAFAFV